CLCRSFAPAVRPDAAPRRAALLADGQQRDGRLDGRRRHRAVALGPLAAARRGALCGPRRGIPHLHARGRLRQLYRHCPLGRLLLGGAAGSQPQAAARGAPGTVEIATGLPWTPIRGALAAPLVYCAAAAAPRAATIGPRQWPTRK